MNYYNEIKKELINNEINKKVKNYSINRADLNTYYKVGKMLSEAGKHYGAYIIKEYAKKLTAELGKGYTQSSLKRYRQFYIYIEKGATMSHQLSYSHCVELLSIDDINEVNFYINASITHNLSVRNLRNKIRNKEYERLSYEAKEKINKDEILEIKNLIPNPIIIKNNKNIKKITHNKTVGIIIVKHENKFVIEYASDPRIIAREYKII